MLFLLITDLQKFVAVYMYYYSPIFSWTKAFTNEIVVKVLANYHVCLDLCVLLSI